MRVAPSEPGGELAEHTGLAVNTIPAQGIAEAPADRLVLAPQQFVLADEDKAASVLSEIAPASWRAKSGWLCVYDRTNCAPDSDGGG